MTRTLLFAFALCCALPSFAAEPEPALTGFSQWLQRWDHAEPGEEAIMWAKQDAILAGLANS